MSWHAEREAARGSSDRLRKVAVFGNAGGGKSTLARRLAEVTGLPLYPLDAIQYRTGGGEVPHEEYLKKHAELLRQDTANPKMALFFASVFPQFAPAGSGALPVLLLLGLVFSGLTLSWLTLYAVVTARAHQVVRGSRLGRAIDGTCGITLLGLGVKVAMERR